jgi:uncharacterized protein YlxP (DUF503 family)
VRSEAALGVLLLELHFPGSHSLKEKRQPLTSVRDVVQRRYRASFSEVGHQDVWQRSRVLVAVTGSSMSQGEGQLSGIERHIHGRDDLVVSMTILRTVENVIALWDLDG